MGFVTTDRSLEVEWLNLPYFTKFIIFGVGIEEDEVFK
jgi:hypothetical protein